MARLSLVLAPGTNLAVPDLVHHRLRAPVEDGAALIDPPASEARRLIAENRAKAATWDGLSGVPFSTWREQAKADLVAYCEALAQFHPGFFGQGRAATWQKPTTERPFILSGHQPTL